MPTLEPRDDIPVSIRPVIRESSFGSEEEEEAIGEDEEDDAIFEDEVVTTRIPLVTSHISNGSLNSVAFLETEYGWVPITTRVPLPGGYKGKAIPIANFGAETASPYLNQAMTVTSAKLDIRAASQAQEREISALVKRARAGDQNAMAILSLVTRNARMGSERAQSAYSLIRDYIRENPHSQMSGESASPGMWAHIWLANGPELSTDRVKEYAASFGAENEVAFLQGVVFFKHKAPMAQLSQMYDELKMKIVEIGKMFGKARDLQNVRKPGSDLKAYSARLGLEFS